MYENGYMNPFGYNTMPTATQPFGYPVNPYMYSQQPQQKQQPQPQPQQQAPTMINTNKLYANGLEDVKNRSLPPNSDYIFVDNDKDILYQRIVDGTGKSDTRMFDLLPHIEKEAATSQQSVDLDKYVLKTDFETLQGQIKALNDKIAKLSTPTQPTTIRKEATTNGTTTI
jgi:hypothetical protein